MQGMPKEASAMGDVNPAPQVLLRWRCLCWVHGSEGLQPESAHGELCHGKKLQQGLWRCFGLGR